MVLAGAPLAPHLAASTELVRMRNALLLRPGSAGDFSWTPQSVPADFKLESGPPAPRFAAIVSKLDLDTMPSDWDRAVALARAMRVHPASGTGGPIQSDLDRTYDGIVASGEGYCGDYVRVYTALALAAGIPVRSWAFSFDGFGGHGHIFNEIWNRDAKRWQMIDVFNNYYFVRGDGPPLSALEFRAALTGQFGDLRMLPVEPRSRPGFKNPDRAWDYYRRGIPEWYMWWGNNVYSYDRAALVVSLGHVSRSLEELGGIAEGVHPMVNVMSDERNSAAYAGMRKLRWMLLGSFALAIVAVLGMVVCAVGWWRGTRRAGGRLNTGVVSPRSLAK